MEKKREISADEEPRPMSAPREYVALLQARARTLGMDWKQIVEKASSRQSAWRASKNDMSMSLARKVAELIDRAATKRGMPALEQVDRDLAEWLAVGHDLAALSPERFEEILRSLQAWTKAELATRAILKPTPDSDD